MLSAVVQLLWICVYWGAISNDNDLLFGACLAQVLGLLMESLLGVMWSTNMGRHEWINFYIRLGAIQRQAAAEEMPPSFFKIGKKLRRRERGGGRVGVEKG